MTVLFECVFFALYIAWKLGPALAAGCTVVMKPAEQTPLSVRIVESLSVVSVVLGNTTSFSNYHVFVKICLSVMIHSTYMLVC